MSILVNNQIVDAFDLPFRYPTEGLISYYSMDEASGTTLYDKVSGYNATITGGYLKLIGKNNTCYYNSSGYASLGNSSYHNFDHTTPFTINCWVKGTTNLASRMYITKMQKPFAVPYNGWGLFKNAGGQLQFFMGKNPATQKFELRANTSYNVNYWNNICVTYDGSNTIDGFNLYLNGDKLSTTTVTDLPFSTESTKNNGVLRISGFGTNSTQPYYIDEIGIFNTPLTEFQIKSIYNDGNGIFY